jgi:hypothetical protein
MVDLESQIKSFGNEHRSLRRGCGGFIDDVNSRVTCMIDCDNDTDDVR